MKLLGELKVFDLIQKDKGNIFEVIAHQLSMIKNFLIDSDEIFKKITNWMKKNGSFKFTPKKTGTNTFKGKWKNFWKDTEHEKKHEKRKKTLEKEEQKEEWLVQNVDDLMENSLKEKKSKKKVSGTSDSGDLAEIGKKEYSLEKWISTSTGKSWEEYCNSINSESIGDELVIFCACQALDIRIFLWSSLNSARPVHFYPRNKKSNDSYPLPVLSIQHVFGSHFNSLTSFGGLTKSQALRRANNSNASPLEIVTFKNSPIPKEEKDTVESIPVSIVNSKEKNTKYGLRYFYKKRDSKMYFYHKKETKKEEVNTPKKDDKEKEKEKIKKSQYFFNTDNHFIIFDKVSEGRSHYVGIPLSLCWIRM